MWEEEPSSNVQAGHIILKYLATFTNQTILYDIGKCTIQPYEIYQNAAITLRET